jgi:hypothetical protein
VWTVHAPDAALRSQSGYRRSPRAYYPQQPMPRQGPTPGFGASQPRTTLTACATSFEEDALPGVPSP